MLFLEKHKKDKIVSSHNFNKFLEYRKDEHKVTQHFLHTRPDTSREILNPWVQKMYGNEISTGRKGSNNLCFLIVR